ncbi:hypothetical protein BX666DRAFT_1911305 [Dichotomocladium elegans]|nr:hypothetical protein BX666DRAFT_1911305 [Dichotomocladium elegans]
MNVRIRSMISVTTTLRLPFCNIYIYYPNDQCHFIGKRQQCMTATGIAERVGIPHGGGGFQDFVINGASLTIFGLVFTFRKNNFRVLLRSGGSPMPRLWLLGGTIHRLCKYHVGVVGYGLPAKVRGLQVYSAVIAFSNDSYFLWMQYAFKIKGCGLRLTGEWGSRNHPCAHTPPTPTQISNVVAICISRSRSKSQSWNTAGREEKW